MCRCTVIAFVVIVSQNLPIVVSIHLPDMVELIFIKFELLESFLRVDTGKIVFPSYLWLLLAIQIDPDETIDIDVKVNWKKAIEVFVESLQALVSRCFGELAIKAVRPAMVLAGEDL